MLYIYIYQQFLSLPTKRPQKSSTSCWFLLRCFLQVVASAFAHNVTVNHVDLSNAHMSIKGAEAPWTVGFSMPKTWRGDFLKSLLGKKTGSLNLNMFFFVILVMTDTQHAHGIKKYLKQILNSFLWGVIFFSRARRQDSQMF